MKLLDMHKDSSLAPAATSMDSKLEIRWSIEGPVHTSHGPSDNDKTLFSAQLEEIANTLHFRRSVVREPSHFSGAPEH